MLQQFFSDTDDVQDDGVEIQGEEQREGGHDERDLEESEAC